MAKNAPLGLAGIVLMAASIVLLFFIILPGDSNTSPLKNTYFLRADTSGITGAHDVTQWTYFYFCGENNQDCGKARPAPAFGRAWDSNARNAPEQLIGGHGGDTTSTKLFYLWRFGWVLILITLFFEILAFFSGFLACCGRLGSAISGLVSFVALFFSSAAMSLMTATFVIARNAFQSDNRSAKIGTYAFGFAWGSWFAVFLATVLFCIGRRNDGPSVGGHSWAPRRNRSVRSHTYEGRRVKDDYSWREKFSLTAKPAAEPVHERPISPHGFSVDGAFNDNETLGGSSSNSNSESSIIENSLHRVSIEDQSVDDSVSESISLSDSDHDNGLAVNAATAAVKRTGGRDED